MLRFAERSLITVSICLFFALPACAADLTRELNVAAGQKVEITNLYGRVGIRAVVIADKTSMGKLLASSTKGVEETDIKTSLGGRTVISVSPKDRTKRIDLLIEIPERVDLIIQTGEGAIEVNGNFASIRARTDTGTIAVDVPDKDVKYDLWWTESHPRYLADFELKDVKEKSGGRFEIKGEFGQSEKVKKKPEPAVDESTPAGPEENKPNSVSLDLTTALGIILVNVPPSEVMSDLRERPLTNAAKAIVRSGDSLLMEAIRRAAPKYYGDYAKSLPPPVRQPSFAEKGAPLESAAAPVKTALVRVTDLKNRAIQDLDAADFEVLEGGANREILSVERSQAPFNLVLLLDVSGSVENYVNFIRKAARNFVETVDSKDRVSIIIFNEDVKVLSTFTTDKGLLSESLDTFDAGGGTAYYDAIAYTVSDTLRPLKGERTAIVILTDGDDNRSFLSFESLLGSIQESGALVYPLYVPSGLIAAAATGSDIDPLRKKYMSLSAKSEGEGERLANVSGGVYYSISRIGQIQEAYADIVKQLRSAYNVTFKSDASAPADQSRRLKIRSRKPNTFVTITGVKPAT